VIEAMGAGRKAARSIKNYLRIRDTSRAYCEDGKPGAGKLFGLDLSEQNFARIRIA
jgi:glutamate synthase (NADPH/NADH) small chain